MQESLKIEKKDQIGEKRALKPFIFGNEEKEDFRIKYSESKKKQLTFDDEVEESEFFKNQLPEEFTRLSTLGAKAKEFDEFVEGSDDFDQEEDEVFDDKVEKVKIIKES